MRATRPGLLEQTAGGAANRRFDGCRWSGIRLSPSRHGIQYLMCCCGVPNGREVVVLAAADVDLGEDPFGVTDGA